jgi:hypothetical protein
MHLQTFVCIPCYRQLNISALGDFRMLSLLPTPEHRCTCRLLYVSLLPTAEQQCTCIPGEDSAGAWGLTIHLCSAEVQNEWSYNSVPPKCVHGVDRDNLLLSYFVSFKNHKNATRVNRKIIWADTFRSLEGSVRYWHQWLQIITMNFTFSAPCIVLYLCNKNQQNAHFLH